MYNLMRKINKVDVINFFEKQILKITLDNNPYANNMLAKIERENEAVKCKCACHKNVLKKPYGHDTKCCKSMNGFIREPDFLCYWDFCTTCINYRKKHKLPMDKLKPYPHKR